MKTKGIPIWEQYLEYIVVLIALIIFAGFAAMQFIGNPNAIDQAGKTISPANVDVLLEQEAEGLMVYLAPEAPAPVEVRRPDPLVDDFTTHLREPIAPEPEVLLARAFVAPGGDLDGPIEERRFVEPEIPAPHAVVARQYYDALAPDVPSQHAELSERYAEPYDVSWITAAATFDIGEVRRQFSRGEGEDAAPIPSNWYQNRVVILDVKVDRQELVDGQWVNSTLVEPIPGQYSLRQAITGSVARSDGDSMLAQLQDVALQRAIARPEFYPTRNSSWSPPDAAMADVAEEGVTGEVAQKQRLLAHKQKRRVDLQQQLDQLGGALTGGGDTGGDKGGGGGKRGAPGNVGAMAGGGSSEADSAAKDQARRTLTARLERLDKEIERLAGQLEQLTGEQPALVEAPVDANANVFEEDELLVWAHDLEIQPGTTYRYQFTVEVFNPFFARKLNLIKEQHHLADKLTLKSVTSEWGDPIEAKPPVSVFLVQATPPGDGSAVGRGSLGTARVEVFRFANGRWWRETFMVEPGDRVGGIEEIRVRGTVEDPPAPMNIDFGTNWYVLDVIENMQTGDSGRSDRQAALVVLKRIGEPSVSQMRDPLRDFNSPERLLLNEEVELADAAGGLALADS